MKICYLADIKSAHTIKWCEYFISKGYEVHVISLSNGRCDGVNVHSLDVDENMAKVEKSSGKLGYLKKIKRIKELVNEIKPDILHAHYASSYGLLGALTNFHPYIISLWGSDVLLFPKEGIIQKQILKYNFKKADAIFSTSKYMANEAGNYTNKKIDITPFGIDLNIFSNNNNRNDDEISIGIVKGLETIYGIDYLIKAVDKLIIKYPEKNIKLYIVGNGTQYDNLVELTNTLNINDKVEFLGMMSLEEVSNFYNRMNIAAFPSLSESFGVGLLEAQACGVPLVVSDIDAFKETSIIGETSFICKKEDVNSLANELERLILDDDLRESMGKRAEEFVKNKFEKNKLFNYVNSLYEKIVEDIGR